MPHNHEILLVEDSASDADLVMRILRKANLAGRAHRAKDGQEALDFLLGSSGGERGDLAVKLILLDLKMPRIDGVEVLRTLRADHRTSRIPIVIFTSSEEQRDIAECLKLGANSYVVKPMDFSGYERVVRLIVDYWLTVHVQFDHSVCAAGAGR